MTVKQAAAYAEVSTNLVYEWCRLGILPHVRLGSPGKRGCIRIAEADLDAFLKSRKVGTPVSALKHIRM
jgi:excisionase family DNA binding protein